MNQSFFVDQYFFAAGSGARSIHGVNFPTKPGFTQ
jgi:hypothetical protein